MFAQGSRCIFGFCLIFDENQFEVRKLVWREVLKKRRKLCRLYANLVSSGSYDDVKDCILFAVCCVLIRRHACADAGTCCDFMHISFCLLCCLLCIFTMSLFVRIPYASSPYRLVVWEVAGHQRAFPWYALSDTFRDYLVGLTC